MENFAIVSQIHVKFTINYIYIYIQTILEARPSQVHAGIYKSRYLHPGHLDPWEYLRYLWLMSILSYTVVPPSYKLAYKPH